MGRKSTNTDKPLWRTLDEVKAANAADGMHWFSAGANGFFGTRYVSGIIGGRYFVTSEQPPHGPRCYAVREADSRGHIHTIANPGDWPGALHLDDWFRDKADAMEFARSLPEDVSADLLATLRKYGNEDWMTGPEKLAEWCGREADEAAAAWAAWKADAE